MVDRGLWWKTYYDYRCGTKYLFDRDSHGKCTSKGAYYFKWEGDHIGLGEYFKVYGMDKGLKNDYFFDKDG